MTENIGVILREGSTWGLWEVEEKQGNKNSESNM